MQGVLLISNRFPNPIVTLTAWIHAMRHIFSLFVSLSSTFFIELEKLPMHCDNIGAVPRAVKRKHAISNSIKQNE